MDGRTLVRLMTAGTEMARPPYAPLVGELACAMGQVPVGAFAADPHIQATVLAQVAAALSADVITVGVLGGVSVGVETVPRLRAVRADAALGGWVDAGDVAGTRAYGEAGVDLLFVSLAVNDQDRRLRTQANAAAFYGVPTILVAPGRDAVVTAAANGLSGAVVAEPKGDEPGIVGAGLRPGAADTSGEPPRRHSFFWTFAAPAGAEAAVDDLAALGRDLVGSRA